MLNKNTVTIPNVLLFEQVSACLNKGKYVTIPVKGKSMMPFLKEEDRVTLRPFVAKELTKGLIVLARVEGKVVLHRLVKFKQDHICLAGDGNLAVHEVIKQIDILAILVSANRGERIIHLNRRWLRTLGQLWYHARPIRRIMRKLF